MLKPGQKISVIPPRQYFFLFDHNFFTLQHEKQCFQGRQNVSREIQNGLLVKMFPINRYFCLRYTERNKKKWTVPLWVTLWGTLIWVSAPFYLYLMWVLLAVLLFIWPGKKANMFKTNPLGKNREYFLRLYFFYIQSTVRNKGDYLNKQVAMVELKYLSFFLYK